MAIVKNKGVRTLHPDYERYAAKWKRCRDAIAGQDAVHAAGEAYLKKLTDQTPDDYAAYKQRASFFNASWRTIQGFQGMLYRKDPALKVPASIEGYLADVTMAGQSFLSFAKAISYEVLAVGRVGALVDHPMRPEGVEAITMDVAARLGLRPKMAMYAAESIINWHYERIDNQHVLARLVLKETVREQSPDNEFESNDIEQYRVLDLVPTAQGWAYRQRVFRIDKDKDVQIGDDIIPLMDNRPLNRIPFKCIGPDGEEMSLDDPPLIDLIDLNLSHYRTTADYEHGCHFTGLPMLFLAGVQVNEGEKIMLGSQAAIVSSDPNAKGEYIEFTGQGLQSLEKMLDRKERQMAVLGARMLSDEKSQVETLGATAIKRTGENSALSSVAISVSEALQAQLELFAQWGGADGEVVFEINREFLPVQMDAQTLTAIVSAWQAGSISEAEMFDLLKRGDVIDGEKTLAEHQAEVEIQSGPVAPDKPANDTGAALSELDAAIARHERHMNGTEATSEASQQKMMDEMKAARAALAGKSKPKRSGMAM